MILIAGLGNPGKEYEKTRHNYGFMVVDEIQKKEGFPAFSLSDFNAMISKEGNVILAKPQTYMNDSGKAIRGIAEYYKIEPKDIILIHDDADIKLGELKEGESRGSAGHKGVQSTIDELKTNEFKRIRMGIDSEDPSFKIPVIDNKEGLQAVVLKNFSKEEESLVIKAIGEVAEIISEKYIR
jgi:peptidyl-tRNA hydrolase, PTH1 family